MEQKKKSYPSLPSNYVTLAQLQERWLKQQNQINQPQQDPQKQTVAAAPANVTASTSRNHAERHRPQNRNDSGTNRSKTEAGAGIGDESANLDGKVGESRKKKKRKCEGWKSKRKPKVKERGANEEGSAAQGNEEAKKTTIESELNGDSVRVEEVEQKFGVLSVEDSRKGKQNGRVRKMNDGFRHSQSQRNYHGSYGYHYGYGNFNGERSKVRMQRSEKMVWVRKDGGVNEIET